MIKPSVAILLLLGMLVWLRSSAILAQTQPVELNKNAKELSLTPEVQAILQPKLRAWLDSLEERARKMLTQQLTDGRFLLYAKANINPAKFMNLVTGKSSNTRLLTLPINVTVAEKQKIAAENINIAQIALISGAVTIALTFDTDVPAPQVNALKEAVADSLGLNPNQGDSIIVKKAPLVASGTNTKIEDLTTKIAEGSKDLDKFRYESNLSQQKIALIEADRLKLRGDLQTAQDKNSAIEERLRAEIRKLEDEISVYKTPLGDVKKIVKGLELPLTILPIAFLLFIFAAFSFFLYLRLQASKTDKFMQAAHAMATALAKGGRGNSSPGLAIDAARTELAKLPSHPSEEMPSNFPIEAPQALLGEELAATRQEALAAWNELKKYPYLCYAELREWLVAGGKRTQRFIALVNALGPVEGMRLLTLFAHEDLAFMREESQDHASKLPGYVALLELHRNVSAEAIQRPPAVASLDFPELIRASDEALALALNGSSSRTLALCINLLAGPRKSKVFQALEPDRQKVCVDGLALLEVMATSEIPRELTRLRAEISPHLAATAIPRLGAADDIARLLAEGSPKVKASLRESLGQHSELLAKITAKIISFDDVFALDDETLNELLDDFDPEQIAILVCGLQQNAQARISKMLSRKVMIGVSNEFQRLNSRQSALKRAQAQSIILQEQLAERLKTLISEGVVEIKKKDDTTDKATPVSELESKAASFAKPRNKSA